MRKIYALMVLLFAVLQLPAQVLVQGRPHPTAKPQMKSGGQAGLRKTKWL